MWRRLALLIPLVALLGLPAATAEITESMGWITKCDFSHRKMVDPIVYPGQPGASHSHEFYGNRSTNAFSTYQTMLGKRTTCGLRPDMAGYWIPTMYLDGTPVVAHKVSFYYRNVVEPVQSVQPFPRDLRIIVGDPHSTVDPNVSHIYWECGDDAPHTVAPQDCGSENLVLHVKFPECWDGVNTDSPDHKSHMTWSSGDPNTCPASHPVVLPRLIERFEWEGVHDGTRVSFASGNYQTVHADFWNTWRQYKLAWLVVHCINAQVDCGIPTVVPF